MKDEMKYIQKDGVLYPDIEMPEQKEFGKWGLLHLGYLKRFRVARYNELLMSGDLNPYLYKVNEEAQERYESLIVDLAESHGLTEELKEKDQMKWVGLANYIVKLDIFEGVYFLNKTSDYLLTNVGFCGVL